jgi:hypothetical protein
MKNVMLLLVIACLTGYAFATPLDLVIDDFESYADTAALNASWTEGGTTTQALSTTENVTTGGSQSMEYNYANGSSPYYSKTMHSVTGTSGGSGTAMDMRGYDELIVNFKCTNQSGYLFLKLFDEWGSEAELFYYDNQNYVQPGDWTEWAIDLTSVDPSSLWNVGRIDLYMKGNYGSGQMYFDDIGLAIPEPATIALLGLGGLLLRKRNK